MRTKKAFINILAGGLGTLLAGLFQFISRFVFIRFLSDEYLGISSLFTNILSILSLAELGIGTAICYSLYKPLAGKDNEKISQIMHFFKRTYELIGCVVLLLGLLIIPFLPYLIQGETDLVDVRLIFALYVLQSAASYWFWAYKSILLQADQKLYINKFLNVCAFMVITILQLVTLAMFRNFILYCVLGLLIGIVTNVLSAIVVDKQYPFLKADFRRGIKPLEKEEKKQIFKDVFGMSMFKFNTTVVNSTDNIVISAFIHVKMVALYGNYQTVISGISQVVMQLFAGVTASVGNLETEKDEEKNEFVFRTLQLLCYWVYSCIGVVLLVLVNPFIQFFFGAERVFGMELVLLQILYFVINGFQRTSFIYRDACGLFWKGKLRPVATALLNIVISIVLVQYIGLAGVILGTIISWMLTTFWYDPIMIYKNVFHKSPLRYFLGYLKAAVLCTVAGFGVYCLYEYVLVGMLGLSGIGLLILTLVLALVIPNLVFVAGYFYTEELRYLVGLVKRKR